jgi:imidazolonepropionase-like amidohydrolase
LYSDNIATPRELFRALKRAIDAGLSPDDAIRALTLGPAEIFGVADRLGSIDKGKIANLVVVKGDLLQERPQVQYIFIDGAKYEPIPEIETPARQTESGGVQ